MDKSTPAEGVTGQAPRRGLPPLPPRFVTTRESLRALACYVVAPARKGRTGRIGLRPTGDGFGTPVLDDGSRLVVQGDQLRYADGSRIAITTLRAAAVFARVELSPDPGVGHDLPPYAPDDDLRVDPQASSALGAWYAFGQDVLEEIRATVADGSVSEAELWPEHFDLAVTIDLSGDVRVNVGFSPGDSLYAAPYVYVGPHDTEGLEGRYWNAPFGALLRYGELEAASDPHRAAQGFISEGLNLLSSAARAQRVSRAE